MRAAALASVLGDWTHGDGATYERLAAALARLIRRGRLAAGERLPAERGLATALAVSRTTVVRALARLRRDGLVASRHGSGWTVCGPVVGGRWRRPLDEPATARFGRGGAIDLTFAATVPLPLVTEELQALVATDLPALAARSGYGPAGLGVLRRAIAARLTGDGVPTTAEEIVVTTGAQQALSLLAALLVRPRDVVAVEEATHPGALDAFRAAGAALHPVPLDEDGMRVDRLDDVAGVRLVYLTPTFSTPSTTVLSLERRRRLARWAARARVPVVEDLAPADLSLDAVTPPPPVSHFGTRGPVLAVGSMSKLFWPGLRVGWVRAPVPLVAQLQRLKATADLGTPLLDQALAARLLSRWDEAQELRRRQYGPGRARLGAVLDARLPRWTWRRPAGGFAIWARLPAGDARAFAAVAVRHGVTLAPGPLFAPDEAQVDRVFLEYTLPPRLLDEAGRRLARAWEAYAASLETR